MTRWPLLLIASAGAACSKPKPGQPYKEAVELVCHADDAPGFDQAAVADRATVMSQYVAEKVTNADVRTMIDAIGGATALGRRHLLRDAIKQAGLDTCPALEKIAPYPVPDVGEAHLETLDARGVVVISEDAILIAETPVVTLQDFVPEASELDGERLPKLTEQIEPVAAIHPGSLTLIVDPRTPYRLLFQIIDSVKDRYHRFALTATSDSARGEVPIVLPDAAAPAPSPDLERMIVGLSDDAVTLFSLSGREGTLGAPAMRVSLDDLAGAQAALQEKLAEIVERRWKDKTRTAESKRIVLLSSDAVPASVYVPILAAMRMRGDLVLYPDVALSAGIVGSRVEAAEDAPPPGGDLIQQIEEDRDTPRGALGAIEVVANVETSLTSEVVTAKLEGAYHAGILRCFKSQHALDAASTGRVKLVFTVSRNGRVVDPRAESEFPALDACLAAQMKAWRYPVAVDADGDTREAELQVTLDLPTGAPP